MPKKTVRPVRVRHRSKAPLYQWEGKNLKILCPFCDDPHPIDAQKVAACGTILHVTAIQEVWKGATCALCGQNDGEKMVLIGDQYRHIANCSPGKKLFLIPPKASLVARMLYKSPRWVHALLFRTIKKVPAKLSQGEKIKYTWDRPTTEL